MTIIDAYTVLNKCTVLTLDEEVNNKYSRVSIDGRIYPFRFVHEAKKSITIPIDDYNPSELVEKEVEYVS